MATKLSLLVRQAGGMAYIRCFSQGAYDVLMDDELFAELAALWDCATLETLQAHIAQTSPLHPAQAYLEAVRAQVGVKPSRTKAGGQPQPVTPGL